MDWPCTLGYVWQERLTLAECDERAGSSASVDRPPAASGTAPETVAHSRSQWACMVKHALPLPQ
jgi:hypothetical protein